MSIFNSLANLKIKAMHQIKPFAAGDNLTPFMDADDFQEVDAAPPHALDGDPVEGYGGNVVIWIEKGSLMLPADKITIGVKEANLADGSDATDAPFEVVAIRRNNDGKLGTYDYDGTVAQDKAMTITINYSGYKKYFAVNIKADAAISTGSATIIVGDDHTFNSYDTTVMDVTY